MLRIAALPPLLHCPAWCCSRVPWVRAVSVMMRCASCPAVVHLITSLASSYQEVHTPGRGQGCEILHPILVPMYPLHGHSACCAHAATCFMLGASLCCTLIATPQYSQDRCGLLIGLVVRPPASQPGCPPACTALQVCGQTACAAALGVSQLSWLSHCSSPDCRIWELRQ
jgi:hypothetical protein